ncbi:MAG: glucose-1-phosphate adenylyltransferase [Bacteroidota bacterium]
MNKVLALILGGGQGTRLYPLTKLRAKPAIPLAGKYRLIDIPVSNCINSGILKIYVLTQFNSASLNAHINTTYRFSPFSTGFVEVIAAQQTPTNPHWFQGTADAVRKSLWFTERFKMDEYLILSGDHLYRMDYRTFLKHHRSLNADVTISVIPVSENQAPAFGILKIDDNFKIVDFKEKPRGEQLTSMKVDANRFGSGENSSEKPYLGSMGIYIFKRKVLEDLLVQYPDFADFGKDLIPQAIKKLNVCAYVFRGYWEDIGTIETFYKANLSLVKQPNPDFSFYDEVSPIFTRPRFLPPSKILDCKIEETMVCDGCILKGSHIRNSIIGIRSRIEDRCVIENSLLMGADYYQSAEERAEDISVEKIPMGIGENSVIRNAIIDKNACIGKNVQIINKDNVQHLIREKEGYWIQNGIITVMKGAVIPDNAML